MDRYGDSSPCSTPLYGYSSHCSILNNSPQSYGSYPSYGYGYSSNSRYHSYGSFQVHNNWYQSQVPEPPVEMMTQSQALNEAMDSKVEAFEEDEHFRTLSQILDRLKGIKVGISDVVNTIDDFNQKWGKPSTTIEEDIKVNRDELEDSLVEQAIIGYELSMEEVVVGGQVFFKESSDFQAHQLFDKMPRKELAQVEVFSIDDKSHVAEQSHIKGKGANVAIKHKEFQTASHPPPLPEPPPHVIENLSNPISSKTNDQPVPVGRLITKVLDKMTKSNPEPWCRENDMGRAVKRSQVVYQERDVKNLSASNTISFSRKSKRKARRWRFKLTDNEYLDRMKLGHWPILSKSNTWLFVTNRLKNDYERDVAMVSKTSDKLQSSSIWKSYVVPVATRCEGCVFCINEGPWIRVRPQNPTPQGKTEIKSAQELTELEIDVKHYFCETRCITGAFIGRIAVQKLDVEFEGNKWFSTLFRNIGLPQHCVILLQGFTDCKTFGSLGQQARIVALTARRSRLHPGNWFLSGGLNSCYSNGNEVEYVQLVWVPKRVGQGVPSSTSSWLRCTISMWWGAEQKRTATETEIHVLNCDPYRTRATEKDASENERSVDLRHFIFHAFAGRNSKLRWTKENENINAQSSDAPEMIKRKLSSVLTIAPRLTGMSDILEVLEPSFRSYTSAMLEDLVNLQESILKKKQHLEIMLWCIRRQFVENVRSKYLDFASWSPSDHERKPAVVKRAWSGLMNSELSGQSISSLFTEALSYLDSGRCYTDKDEGESSLTCGGNSFLRSMLHGMVGIIATLPNYENVAVFFQVRLDKGPFHFDNNYRHAPLVQQNIGITVRKPSQVEFLSGHVLWTHKFTPDNCSLNMVMRGLCLGSKVGKAIEILEVMKHFGCLSNFVTYHTLIKGLCRVGKVNRAQEINFRIKRGVSTTDTVSVSYDDFINDVEVRDAILVDEGMMPFAEKSKIRDEAKCEIVVDGGELKSMGHLTARGKNETLLSDHVLDIEFTAVIQEKFLIAQNSIILKTARQTPLSTLLATSLLYEVGLPGGVLNVVSGFGLIASIALCSHSDGNQAVGLATLLCFFNQGLCSSSLERDILLSVVDNADTCLPRSRPPPEPPPFQTSSSRLLGSFSHGFRIQVLWSRLVEEGRYVTTAALNDAVLVKWGSTYKKHNIK